MIARVAVCAGDLPGARNQESSPSIVDDASIAAMTDSLNAVISEAEVQALMAAITAPLNVTSFTDKSFTSWNGGAIQGS